jgi:RND family efflux transporter MFP subunit
MDPASDLTPLTIDRSGARSTSARARRRRPMGRWIALGILAALAWLFRFPLMAALDRWRLPEVSTVRVVKSSPLAASAVSGTAANGYVVASRRAALSADTPGRIVELNVIEGSVVKRGDVVARLYADEYRAAERQAAAELLAAQSSVVRARAQMQAAEHALSTSRAIVAARAAALEEALAARKLAELEHARARTLLEQKVGTQRELDLALADAVRSAASERSAQAGLTAAQSEVAAAEASLNAAKAAWEESQARLPVLQAALELARATLEKTEVRAPFDGVVVLKDAEVGEVVSPNSLGGNSRGSVATMVDFASLEVQVELSESMLASAVVGEPAKIILDAYPQVVYAGRVQRIWPTANRQKATVEVRVSFLQPDGRLRPEMGARVVFGGSEQAPGGEAPALAAEQILIPLACLVKQDGQEGVLELERDRVRFRALTLGEERLGKVLVQAGLNGGETLVVAPPGGLREGGRVRVKQG